MCKYMTIPNLARCTHSLSSLTLYTVPGRAEYKSVYLGLPLTMAILTELCEFTRNVNKVESEVHQILKICKYRAYVCAVNTRSQNSVTSNSAMVTLSLS